MGFPLSINLTSCVLRAWRLHRILACYFLFRYAASVKHASRKDPNYLILVLATTYTYNAIHSRPSPFSGDRALMGLVLDEGTLDENYDAVRDTGFHSPRSFTEKVPYSKRGGILLPAIRYPCSNQGDVLRFEFLDNTLEYTAIAKPFKMKWQEIVDRFTAAYRKDPYKSGHLQPKRVTKSDDPLNRVITLPAGHQDFSFIPVVDEYYDQADDLPQGAVIGCAPDTSAMDASAFFLGLCSQMFQRIGNIGRTGTRYSNLSDVDWLRINFETCSDMNISAYLKAYQYERRSTPKQWKRVRSLLFPDTSDNVPVLNRDQGWHMMPLYVKYRAMREVGGPGFIKLRKFCWDMFDQFHWFPVLQYDRVIRHKLREGWVKIPKIAQTAVPIILNPKFRVRVASYPGRAPVLDPLVGEDDDEDIAELRRQHDETLDPIVQEMWRGMAAPEDEVPQRSREPPSYVMQHVREKARRKQGGRTVLR